MHKNILLSVLFLSLLQGQFSPAFGESKEPAPWVHDDNTAADDNDEEENTKPATHRYNITSADDSYKKSSYRRNIARAASVIGIGLAGFLLYKNTVRSVFGEPSNNTLPVIFKKHNELNSISGNPYGPHSHHNETTTRPPNKPPVISSPENFEENIKNQHTEEIHIPHSHGEETTTLDLVTFEEIYAKSNYGNAMALANSPANLDNLNAFSNNIIEKKIIFDLWKINKEELLGWSALECIKLGYYLSAFTSKAHKKYTKIQKSITGFFELDKKNIASVVFFNHKKTFIFFKEKRLENSGSFKELYKILQIKHGDQNTYSIKVGFKAQNEDTKEEIKLNNELHRSNKAVFLKFNPVTKINHITQQEDVLFLQKKYKGYLWNENFSNHTKKNRLAYHMADALNHLHKTNRTHRDIKPANFLVSQDLSKIALIDFGSAMTQQQLNTCTCKLGIGITTAYQDCNAPSCCSEYSLLKWQQRDIYAFGLTLFQVFIDISEYKKHFEKLKKKKLDQLRQNQFHSISTPITENNKNLMSPLQRTNVLKHRLNNRHDSRLLPANEDPEFYGFYINYKLCYFNEEKINQEFHFQMHSALFEMIKNNGTHDSLEKIIMDCLNSNPEHRPNAQQLANRLQAFL